MEEEDTVGGRTCHHCKYNWLFGMKNHLLRDSGVCKQEEYEKLKEKNV